MTTTISLDDLANTLLDQAPDTRCITAIAGAPGSGKSTLAEALVDRLNKLQPGSAAVFPMDGYHYDDILLNARGWRARKGAPHTFDIGGFAAMLTRLRENTEDDIAVPVFDRDIEIARNAARIISQEVRHVIVEGNYLLLDAPGWRDLKDKFDFTVFLDVPLPELRRRLTERWAKVSEEERKTKLDGNDLPNAELVQLNSLPADFIITD